MEPELDKIRLLERIRMEHAFFERTLALLTPEEMLIPNVSGEWSVKDILAHCTVWMQRVMLWFDQAGHGQTPDIPERGYTWDDIDGLNVEYAARDRDLPLHQVLADFRQAHLDVCDFVQAFSDDQLFESDWSGAFSNPPWTLIPPKTYLHLYEHVVPIRRWIAARNG